MSAGRSRTSSEEAIRWPVVAIDIEASALGPDSYPIEVGLARWKGPEAMVETWSTLIRPAPEWGDRRWSTQSQAIHGIARADLDDGMAPSLAMVWLNHLAGNTVHCDGGTHDAAWLATLERAADREAEFVLVTSDRMGATLGPRRWTRMQDWLKRAKPRHRAGPDAERLVRGLVFAMGRSYGTSVPMR